LRTSPVDSPTDFGSAFFRLTAFFFFAIERV
jgi:hypothetical protein